MTRVKGGTHSLKRRRTTLAQTKGYRFGRSTKERQAREALKHAGRHAFQHRHKKKGDFRRLWTVRINAGLKQISENLSYSRFIKQLTDAGIQLNRKTLSEMAEKQPSSFKRVVEKVIK